LGAVSKDLPNFSLLPSGAKKGRQGRRAPLRFEWASLERGTKLKAAKRNTMSRTDKPLIEALGRNSVTENAFRFRRDEYFPSCGGEGTQRTPSFPYDREKLRINKEKMKPKISRVQQRYYIQT